jgi:hypothetical protein
VVTGAGGRLGAALSAELVSAGHKVTGLSRTDLDVTDGEQVATVMRHLRPEVIVNCSAYNAVDAAESDPAAAFAANAEGPSFLADAAEATEALLIHYSTDFVFDGRALEPYSEDAPANPLGVYGASKLAGEHEVRRARRHYILRVESLFGGRGANGHRATVDQIAVGDDATRPVPGCLRFASRRWGITSVDMLSQRARPRSRGRLSRRRQAAGSCRPSTCPRSGAASLVTKVSRFRPFHRRQVHLLLVRRTDAVPQPPAGWRFVNKAARFDRREWSLLSHCGSRNGD